MVRGRAGKAATTLNKERPVKDWELWAISALVKNHADPERLMTDARNATVKQTFGGSCHTIKFIRAAIPPRHTNGPIIESSYTDKDGERVEIAVYLDQYGDLYELDMYRHDGKDITSHPSEKNIEPVAFG